MRPYTAHEYAIIPHVIMTSDQDWDPSYSDNEIDPADPSFYENTDYNVHGEYIHAFQANVPVSIPAPPVANATAPVPPADDGNIHPHLIPPRKLATKVPPAHSVLRQFDRNPLLSHDPMDDLASNGCAEFDEFTAGCLFEDAVDLHETNTY